MLLSLLWVRAKEREMAHGRYELCCCDRGRHSFSIISSLFSTSILHMNPTHCTFVGRVFLSHLLTSPLVDDLSVVLLKVLLTSLQASEFSNCRRSSRSRTCRCAKRRKKSTPSSSTINRCVWGGLERGHANAASIACSLLHHTPVGTTRVYGTPGTHRYDECVATIHSRARGPKLRDGLLTRKLATHPPPSPHAHTRMQLTRRVEVLQEEVNRKNAEKGTKAKRPGADTEALHLQVRGVEKAVCVWVCGCGCGCTFIATEQWCLLLLNFFFFADACPSVFAPLYITTMHHLLPRRRRSFVARSTRMSNFTARLSI